MKDEHRCRARAVDQRRCQLYAHHEGPHAFAWQVRLPGSSRRGRYPWRNYLVRWTDSLDEPWHEQPGAEQLPWVAMWAVDDL
jgi:hypothetical protein